MAKLKTCLYFKKRHFAYILCNANISKCLICPGTQVVWGAVMTPW